ncbi:hypothetical protein FIV00_10005 [Labrenzia sp. THAF82]|nr:hypothetical protein FIV00_10005 [Labrenzia sp. THAF82]
MSQGSGIGLIVVRSVPNRRPSLKHFQAKATAYRSIGGRLDKTKFDNQGKVVRSDVRPKRHVDNLEI